MRTPKLPQPYALRIEMIRAKGYKDHQVLEIIRRGNASELLENICADVNWDSFLEYCCQHGELIKAAVTHGYQFAFITVNGIKSLLSIKFNKQADRDYHFNGTCIDLLKLNADELQQLRRMVPEHWRFVETNWDLAWGITHVRIELYAASQI